MKLDSQSTQNIDETKKKSITKKNPKKFQVD
jgi:hypothetical protein